MRLYDLTTERYRDRSDGTDGQTGKSAVVRTGTDTASFKRAQAPKFQKYE